jgi:SARP family transcriptional regulator, regulator of embCAB operon
MVSPGTRIQLCGRLVARIEGRPVEDLLPGRQGRLLFAYLVLNRTRAVRRDELAEAVWPAGPPAAPEVALRALLSKLRGALGDATVEGREAVRICLPPGATVDVEVAIAALHRAESAIARGDWTSAWGPAQVALFTAGRELLSGEDVPWIDEQRRSLADLHLRALEAYGIACLQIRGTELPAAERSGRALSRLAPFRESGHRLLIESLEQQGNLAEALRAYDSLRELLRAELGISPSPAMRQLHARLLESA